ncbi:NYN domain-containing protein [Patescibacteria group bacterium]
MNENHENNLAFIDGQNLYLSLQSCDPPWKCDFFRFRKYLQKKYRVKKAYYFLGFVNESFQDLYGQIQEAGFILVFKQHHAAMLGEKKGNVDTDIVFHVMKKLYRQEDFDKIVLISGDGDYKTLVDFLLEEKRLKKILFPNKVRASSLYKRLPTLFHDDLSAEDVKKKIKLNKKGSP